MIEWNATTEEMDLILQVADRAVVEFIDVLT